MITSDLALIQRFRLLERLQVGAILDELEFGQDARVDQTTAARIGRLMRAERMVQGLAAIPTEGDVRLEASVVQSTGEVSAPSGVTGRFRDMLDLEKELVIDLVAGLGYQLSEAERQALLRNGPQNLAAFLAYSNGLFAEDLGDYGAAAAFYTQAVQADPGFQEARQRRQGATAAPAVQQATAGEVTTVANTTVSEPEAFGSDPARDALAGAIGDLAATQAEQNSETAEDGRDVEDVAKQPTATVASEPQPSEVVVDIVTPAIIRIVFRLP